MKKYTFDLPALYADHHVSEVRRILLDVPGVEDVYASSAFKAAEVSVDESKVDEEQLQSVLEEAGYLGELPIETEVMAANDEDDAPFFRKSALYQQTKSISFAQEMTSTGRPLWPCPGMGPLKIMVDEE